MLHSTGQSVKKLNFQISITPWLKFSHQEYPVATGNCFKYYLSPLLAHIISSPIWLSLISRLWNGYISLFYAQARLLFLHREEQNHSLIFVLPACLRISFQTQGVVIEFSHSLSKLLWWQICVQHPSLTPLAQHLTRNITRELSLWPGSNCWTPQLHQGYCFQTFCSKLECIRLEKLCLKARLSFTLDKFLEIKLFVHKSTT